MKLHIDGKFNNAFGKNPMVPSKLPIYLEKIM